MNDQTQNRELFKKLLIEARLKKSQQFIDSQPEEVVFSEKHIRKMQSILSHSDNPTHITYSLRNKKRVIALLVAAAMIIAGGITVYAARNTIVSFVQKIYEKYTDSSFQSNENAAGIPEWIEQEYTMTYVPEGYELEETTSDLINFRMTWKNNNETIKYMQSVIGSNSFITDNENSYDEQIQIENYEIYCTHHSSKNSIYIWTDNVYGYKIECPSDIAIEELAKMINSISKTE